MHEFINALQIYLRNKRGKQIHDALLKMAHEEDRSKAFIGRVALEEYLIKKGYLE